MTQEQREMFDWVIQKIDKWATNEKNTGPLRIIKTIDTKKIVVTHSYKTNIAQLKTYLLFDVMKLYWAGSDNSSKINYSYVQKLVDGNDDKSYYIEFDNLNDYFDIDKNRTALQEECIFVKSLFHKQSELKNLFEDEDLKKEWIPFLLLRDIQNTARKALGEYYKKCKKWLKFSKVEQEDEKKRKKFFQEAEKLHKKFLFLVALHEIFWLETFDDCIGDAPKQATELLNQIIGEMETVTEGDESFEQREVKILELANQLEKKQKKVLFCSILQKFYEEFAISLAAEQQILMMFELLWLNNMQETTWHISEFLENKIKYYLKANLVQEVAKGNIRNTNRNANGIYEEAFGYIMDVFKQIEDTEINMLEWFQMGTVFLEELEKLVDTKKEPDFKKIWEAQCEMARWIL